MSLREEQCNKVCRILDDVLANRPTERDTLIVAVRKAFAEPKRGKWIHNGSRWENRWICSECGDMYWFAKPNFCPNCGSCNGGGAKMEVTT